MISLVLDHHRIHAAIVTDGGDFVCTTSTDAPRGEYRDWLLAARDLIAGLSPCGNACCGRRTSHH